MKDKKILILSIAGVLMLVSIAIASSYAYFTANVTGNKDTNNVVITNGVMSLEYKDGDEITLKNAVPGDSITKTFTVKNTGNVATNYTIYFSELSNKFVDKTDLVYTLTSSDGGKSVAQTQVPDSNLAMVSNYEIEAGKTHTYTLTITFLEKNEKQDDNQNVLFSTKVTINETKETETPSGGGVASTITALATTDTTNFATDDPDNNIRYIGADPNNYAYFNCSDYSNQSDSTCEKWRIIGVFKNMTKEDGSKEDLVKIIRDDSLGDIAWNSSGVNDWSTASLQTTLNDAYYNGTYETEAFKNDSTRNAIENVLWNLGGVYSGDAVGFYNSERGTTVYSGHATTWIGKIGLMYPSDYGYATVGGVTTNRESCLSKLMTSWSDVSDCYNNDYLFKETSEWTLTPFSTYYYAAFYIDVPGNVDFGLGHIGVSDVFGVRPTLYLKSNILISQGDGSSSNPYQLNLN